MEPVKISVLQGWRWGPLALTAWAMPAAGQPPAPVSAATFEAHARFADQAASNDTLRLTNWVSASGDNRGLPFVIIDKIGANVFVFDARGKIRGAAPALLGLARGDDQVAGIGQRKLATIRPSERITPAGRFEAALGRDLEQDLLWIDYDAALSLHRVIVGKPADRRHARLASPTPFDNRITFGCVNVPAQFYDSTIIPTFKGTVGIVYILPEMRPLEAVFPMAAPRTRTRQAPLGSR
ncbi:L,D-transpeptidase [Novosphingobium sp. FKTRR1]|uniref:L,D-transpeptidase n=1 Tax=Novosphingobium sp. FKTRR1 TaxID=2879118 RepID=UPI001CF01134|nr:L,D-transpeptidase [Novosphingobium sp. FKTRR1]